MNRRVGVVGAAACLLPLLLVFLIAPLSLRADAGVGRSQSEDDPLSLKIRSLTPGVIANRGPIVLSGLIVNTSDEEWTEISVYPWRSTLPITGLSGLELAALTDPALGVGTRIVDTSDRIERLAPGEAATWHVRIPRDLLGIDQAVPGVYWIGVQVLASNVDGRDGLADGRARTFIPVLGRRPSTVPTALVVPVRERVAYTRTGSVVDEAAWVRSLAPGGRLRRVVDFLGRAPSGTVTVLVDPAVLDAVQRLANENPARDLGPVDEEPEPTPTAEPSPTDAVSRSAPSALLDLSAPQLAADWLQDFTVAAKRLSLLALPYGDLDVDAAAQHDPELMAKAVDLSRAALERFDLTATIAVVPPTGYVRPDIIEGLAPAVRVLASDLILPEHRADPADDPTSVLVGTRAVRLIGASASSGGPLPGKPHVSLQVRQRILAEAALRSADASPQPLVVMMPTDWDPGTSSPSFFPELDRDWLSLVPESAASTAVPPSLDARDLLYPGRLAERELDSTLFAAADRLVAAGVTMENFLTAATDVADEVAGQALTGASYFRRDDGAQALLDLDYAERNLRRHFFQIRIAAPPYVTLSSTTGRFRVDLANDLEYAVTVRIEAITDPALTIQAPAEIELRGQSRTTILLSANSEELGVHQVTLLVTDLDGTPLGPQDSLPIRANQVGMVIWVIIGGGVALLFGAIALRLYRRFRGPGATTGATT